MKLYENYMKLYENYMKLYENYMKNLKEMYNRLRWGCIINDDWNYFDGFKILTRFFELFEGLRKVLD